MHGFGVFKYSSGDIYEGIWAKDAYIKGKFSYSNGDVYEGEFKHNLMHGYGIF